MQPRSLPVDVAGKPDLNDGGLGDGELALVGDPHAAANKAITPNATAFLIPVRTVKPPVGPARRWAPGQLGTAWGHAGHRARVCER